jgi:hypothetical protein
MFHTILALKNKIIAAIVVLLIVLPIVFSKYQIDLTKAKQTFEKEKAAILVEEKQVIEEKFDQIYRTLRTMSLLPGVRKIDRYGKKFDLDAKGAVQQLYNNVFTTTKVSEIYLLPNAIDPDKIDKNTGKPEEPIMTFDELIVDSLTEKAKEGEAAPKIEEVEIEEYRLMKSQLEYFKEHNQTNKTFEGLNVPIISLVTMLSLLKLF